MIRPARVLPAVQGETLPLAADPPRGRGRVVPAAVVDASLEARRIVEEARRLAANELGAARAEVADVRLRAETEGRAEGAAALAAEWVRLAQEQACAEERALDRTVELARLLAERVLGEELRNDPNRIAALAKQLLREARGARVVTLHAHPEDAKRLEAFADSLSLDHGRLQVVAADRPRGSLRVESDLGALDGELAPQLERLARKLRELLAEPR